MHKQSRVNLFLLIGLVLLFSFYMTACTETTTTNTTTQTTTEATEPCAFDMPVAISNGDTQVDTVYVPCLAYTDSYTADGFCIIYDLLENQEEFALIEQSDNMTIVKSFQILLTEVEVFDDQGTLVTTWDSWEERTLLTTGQYFIVLHIQQNKDGCYKFGHAIFMMNVSET